MTRSQLMVLRIRNLAHEETRNGHTSPLAIAALEMASEYELCIESALKLEACVHALVKETEKKPCRQE